MRIENKFFDLIIYVISLFFSFFRSIGVLFGINKKAKKGIFFESLDYIFRVWPYNFWKKPTLFKVGTFFSDLLNYVFYNKK